MKIGTLSVGTFIDIIENLDENADYESNSPEYHIKDLIKNKISSRKGCFIAIVTMLKFLCSPPHNQNPNYGPYDKAPKILHLKDNGNSDYNSTNNYTFGNDRFFKITYRLPNGQTDNVKNATEILKNYGAESSVEDVIQHLLASVVENKKINFKELAKKGFGVNVDEKLIMNQCQKMYEAGVRQIVFTGAPGTGKTYTVEKFAEEKVLEAWKKKNPGKEPTEKDLCEHIRKVQFHSSYDYSDFVEGLRPVMNNSTMVFVRMDGQFKEFCRKIIEDKERGMPYFFIIDEINRADLSRVFGELMYCLDEDNRSKGVPTQYSNLPTYRIDDDKAIEIIKDDDVFINGFYIPDNLCILATMNDIDRSVEAFDFALRRRFKWIEADANTEVGPALESMLKEKAEEAKISELTQKIIAMNNVIANSGKNPSLGQKLGLSSAYHIGHAYFKTYDDTEESLQNIWETQIKPILKEYCRGKNPKDTNDFINACNAALLQ